MNALPQRERILGLGFACIDDLMLLSEIPLPEGRATVRGRLSQGGGMVATAMVAVARLGGSASFITKVGGDPTGTEILDEFRSEGVDVSRSLVASTDTSHRTTVLVDGRTGARAFLASRGTAGDVQAHELDQTYVSASAILHLSDAGPGAMAAARLVRAAGGKVCLDGTHYHPSVDALLPHLDYLVVSRFFAAEFAAYKRGDPLGQAAQEYAHTLVARDQASPHDIQVRNAPGPSPVSGEPLLELARQLRQRGPDVVAITEGEGGCWYTSVEGDAHVPAWVAPNIVDTTGAGDVFHGAFLFGRQSGRDLGASFELAAAVAALKCTALGGRTGIPTLPITLAFMSTGERHFHRRR